MATLISQPDTLCFSSDIADIVFGSNAVRGDLELDMYYNGSWRQVLRETMYADSSGSITISDISSLAEAYAQRYLQVEMRCTFTDSAGAVSIDPVTILYSLADVGMTASEFTESHFLTILNGEKLTARGREERLYAYGTAVATVIADVQLPSGQFNTLSAELNTLSTNGVGYAQFDVSPDNVANLVGLLSGKLLSYTIEAGIRRQHFRCVEDHVPPAPSLLFTNSFGCQEFIHCVGTHRKDSKYERKSTHVQGRLRNIRITEDRQFTANTGWLNEAMADWADDLFRSPEVYLWVEFMDQGRMRGRQVVITDSKSEISNEDDDMPAFEFKYSYAQRIHNVMQPAHSGRVFDNTFDHTFN